MSPIDQIALERQARQRLAAISVLMSHVLPTVSCRNDIHPAALALRYVSKGFEAITAFLKLNNTRFLKHYRFEGTNECRYAIGCRAEARDKRPA